ncbi:MAG: bifunctional hydroxymethylpyrimidine kinase/phosphomethylpyrimidine kinase [Blastocatellia bacterium]|nr:bifunctional hydroxymethylpyrimidine kinase/phosphomethylpyrimidine kinase [Blastocatellia bacterium]
MSVLVVGSVAFDAVKTPFGEREEIIGGSATHFSISASFFTSVSLVAVVGEDFTQKHEQLFHERKVDIRGLERASGKTFRWKGEYGYDLNTRSTIYTHLNVFADFQPKLPVKETPILFLGNIGPKLQLEVRKQVNTKLVALDTMNYWIESALDDLKEVLTVVDILIINDEEARELAREANIIKAAKKILSMGPKTVVIKRGEYGAAMFSEKSYFAIPAFPAEDVFDPTGAGDSFAGGFIGYLAATSATDEAAMRRAMIYGSVMASFNVEEFGCDRVMRLTYQEINERFRHFKEITHFEEILFERKTGSYKTV